MTYNGWKNYETWVTALWIDNDEGSYQAARDLVRDLISDQGDEDVRPYQVADALKEWAEEAFIDPFTENGPVGLHVDLLRAAWSEIDWYEIAGNYLDEVRAEVA